MAVSNQNQESLAPLYQNIQNALERRSSLELNRPQSLDIATQGVKRVDEELTKQRDFVKAMQREGRVLITPEGVDDFVGGEAMDDAQKQQIKAYIKPFVGTYQKPDSLADHLVQMRIRDQAEAQKMKFLEEANKDESLTATQKALVATDEGRRQYSQQVFSTNKIGKTTIISDPTSSTGRRLALVTEEGVVPTQYEVPKDVGGSGGGTARPLPVAERDRFSALQEIGFNLNKIVDNYSPEAIGLFKSKAAKASQYSEAFSDEQKTSFLQASTALRNVIIKARSGGAVTPQEADRLIDELPDLNTSPTAFKSKLENVSRMYNEITASRRSALEDSGYSGIPKIEPIRYLKEEKEKKKESAGGNIIRTQIQNKIEYKNEYDKNGKFIRTISERKL